MNTPRSKANSLMRRVGEMSKWARLSEPEQARLREFDEFLVFARARGNASIYLTFFEHQELNYLRSKFAGGQIEMPSRRIIGNRLAPEKRHAERLRLRDLWWEIVRRHHPRAVRRDLPVWKEDQPDRSELVSAISEADYVWMRLANEAMSGVERET